MTTQDALPYDLFVICADSDASDDKKFLRGSILPALGLPEDRVASIQPGEPIVAAVARCIQQSKVTLVILSPAFLADAWSLAANDMASWWAVGKGRVVPLIHVPCDVPASLDFRRLIDGTRDETLNEGLDQLRKLLGAPLPEEPEIPCPYPGLRPYTELDATLLGGREREIRSLVDLVRRGTPELCLLGSSGSGKTSLVVAGVIPKLRRPDDATDEVFQVEMLRLGEDPHAELQVAITRLTESLHRRRLLVIDAIEEAFTIASPTERAPFLSSLATLSQREPLQVMIIARADFYGDLLASELLPYVDRAKIYNLGPLRGEPLRSAIVAPAKHVKVDLDSRLVDRLLHDAGEEPGALPLLGETLRKLWETRKQRYLRYESYLDLFKGEENGLAHVLSEVADAAYQKLDEPGRAFARRALLRLVQPGQGRAHTRHSRTLAELCDGERASAERTLDHLVRQRILIVRAGERGERIYDLAHELLITRWPMLSTWVSENLEHEQKRRILETRAADWQRRVVSGQAGGFCDDIDLRELDRWWTDSTKAVLGTSSMIEDFVAASREEVARLAAEREAVVRKERALHARQYLAQAQSLLMNGRGAKAAPYLVAARELDEGDATIHLLWHWAARSLPVHRQQCDAALVAWRPDNQRLALYANGTLSVWHPDLTQSETLKGCAPNVTALAWSDGHVYAAAGGEIMAWQPERSDLRAGTFDESAARVALSAARTATKRSELRAATVSTSGYTAALDKGVLLLRDAEGKPCKAPRTHDCVSMVAWSPVGDVLAIVGAQEATVRLWDAANGRVASPLYEGIGVITAVTWRPDGKQLATISTDGEVALWDTDEPREINASRERDRARDVCDDATLPAEVPATGPLVARPRGKVVELRDKRRDHGVVRILDHKAQVVALAWSRDDRCLAVATADQFVRIWDANGGYQLHREVLAPRPVTHLHWNDEGTRLYDQSDTLIPLPLANKREPLGAWRTRLGDSPYQLVDGYLVLR